LEGEPPGEPDAGYPSRSERSSADVNHTSGLLLLAGEDAKIDVHASSGAHRPPLNLACSTNPNSDLASRVTARNAMSSGQMIFRRKDQYRNRVYRIWLTKRFALHKRYTKGRRGFIPEFPSKDEMPPPLRKMPRKRNR
jgi:hypothetical protein